jgi:hypothetical protein
VHLGEGAGALVYCLIVFENQRLEAPVLPPFCTREEAEQLGLDGYTIGAFVHSSVFVRESTAPASPCSISSVYCVIFT